MAPSWSGASPTSTRSPGPRMALRSEVLPSPTDQRSESRHVRLLQIGGVERLQAGASTISSSGRSSHRRVLGERDHPRDTDWGGDPPVGRSAAPPSRPPDLHLFKAGLCYPVIAKPAEAGHRASGRTRLARSRETSSTSSARPTAPVWPNRCEACGKQWTTPQAVRLAGFSGF